MIMLFCRSMCRSFRWFWIFSNEPSHIVHIYVFLIFLCAVVICPLSVRANWKENKQKQYRLRSAFHHVDSNKSKYRQSLRNDSDLNLFEFQWIGYNVIKFGCSVVFPVVWTAWKLIIEIHLFVSDHRFLFSIQFQFISFQTFIKKQIYFEAILIRVDLFIERNARKIEKKYSLTIRTTNRRHKKKHAEREHWNQLDNSFVIYTYMLFSRSVG